VYDDFPSRRIDSLRLIGESDLAQALAFLAAHERFFIELSPERGNPAQPILSEQAWLQRIAAALEARGRPLGAKEQALARGLASWSHSVEDIVNRN
jgi:hypothetical protein